MYIELLYNNLKSHIEFANKKFLLATSGGPDSMCLVDIFYKLSKRYNFSMALIHFEHGIRGLASIEDASFVENYAKKNSLPFYIEKVDCPNVSKEQKKSLEMVARELRYNFMADIYTQYEYDYLVTAHHKDDQVESILMHFLRGSGIAGLLGMDILAKRVINNKEINLFRPLLNYTKKEILDYCEINHIKYRIDETNFDTKYNRNKLRHNILPPLENYNSNVKNHIINLSNILKEERDYINFILQKLYVEICIFEDKEKIILDTNGLKKQHTFIRKELFRYVYKKLMGHIDNLSFNNIDILDDFLYNGFVSKFIQLPNGVEVRKTYNSIEFVNANRDKKVVDTPIINISLDNIISKKIEVIYLDYKFSMEIINKPIITQAKTEFCYNISNIKGNLTIRKRLDGDKILLNKMGLKKVKDIFINEKIPKQQRDFIPIIADEEKILWLCGIRKRYCYNIDENLFLYIKFENIGGKI